MAPLEVVGLMAATQALLTHADLHSLRLRSRNGRRFELIDGDLIVLPGPPPWHQLFVSGCSS